MRFLALLIVTLGFPLLELAGIVWIWQWAGWWTLAWLAIPIIFFILLESGLRIFSYGFNNEHWTEVSEGKLILNPEIARRYFHKTQSLPYSNQEVFDAVKQKNMFRIFVLGESSAAGFPYAPLGSFSRYLRQRMDLVYPESKIEVVNLGLTAINSYTIRDLFQGVLEMSPDLIIIYTGHNRILWCTWCWFNGIIWYFKKYH